MKLKEYFIIAMVLGSMNALALQCPVPRTAIDFGIDASYKFDNNSKNYIYTYKVTNGSKAKAELFWFIIESDSSIAPVQIPSAWETEFQSADGNYPSHFDFTSSFNKIKPGSSPLEFKVTSKQKPGITRYYAEGSSSGQLQAITVNGDSEAAPTCPGFFMDETSNFRQMITGSTIGPVSASQIEAKLKMKVLKDQPLKNSDGEEESPELSPSDEGVIELILHKTEGFDLGTVDLGSIAFGPYDTKPFSSEILQNGAKIGHWRKKNEIDNKFLLMKFKLSDLKIRCELDHALIFKASAESKKLVGTLGVKPVMCTDKLMKVHKERLKKDPKNYREPETEH